MADRNIPVIDRQKCTVCGMCVDICPEDVLSVEAGALMIANPGACTMCAECESICPEHAISVYYHISWADKEE